MSITSAVVAALSLLLATTLNAAELKFASPFCDHMVLQRDKVIRVWGRGEPGTTVAVNVASRKAETKVAPDSSWTVELQPVAAGGPFRLSAASGDRTVAADDVLFGDVWLCSGQSNMQMTLKECDDGEAVAKLAGKYGKLRLCTVEKGWNARPQTSANMKWREATPETARDFSAVGYYFATEFLNESKLPDVPIGVINSSFGGTTCEGWIPNESLRKMDSQKLHDSMFGIKPGMLYNAMIAPFGRSAITGVVWYQGEANAGRPDDYPLLLTTMIGAWQQQFDSENLPFIIVQLPDFAQDANSVHWQWIREAQAKAVTDTPHCSLAIGINSTDGFNLHPRQKHDIGRRAALLALHDVYKQDIVGRGPVFREAKIEGSAVRVTFDTGGNGMVSRLPGGAHGFAIAGDDGHYRFASAEIDGESVVLRCDQVPSPKTVRYAWAGVPDATLTNQFGLPAGPFRTDSFPPSDIEVQNQPISRHVSTSAYELTVSGTGEITSLGVHGKQFLSNALGTAGGTSIPGWLGERALPDIRELASDILSCGDHDITLVMQFKPDGMEWTLTNRGKEGIEFRIALAKDVVVSGGNDAEPMKLTHGRSVLLVNGINSVTDAEEAKVLHVSVKGETEKRLTLTVDRP